MTTEEVLEMLMKAFTERAYGTHEFARTNYEHECRRVLADAQAVGVQFVCA